MNRLTSHRRTPTTIRTTTTWINGMSWYTSLFCFRGQASSVHSRLCTIRHSRFKVQARHTAFKTAWTIFCMWHQMFRPFKTGPTVPGWSESKGSSQASHSGSNPTVGCEAKWAEHPATSKSRRRSKSFLTWCFSFSHVNVPHSACIQQPCPFQLWDCALKSRFFFNSNLFHTSFEVFPRWFFFKPFLRLSPLNYRKLNFRRKHDSAHVLLRR